MEANQAIVADTQVAGHILKHTFTVHNEDSAGAANFKAGDTFTVLDGNTYTFGSGEGQVVVGKDFDGSMANLTATLNANNAGMAYDAGKGETKMAGGNWSYENQTDTLSFVANDNSQDFAVNASTKSIALRTTPGVIGGITTDKGESTVRLDWATYNITAEQLKASAMVQIGKNAAYTIGYDADFSARLDNLAEQINSDEQSLVNAAAIDGKLQLTTKAAGEVIGDVKIATDASYAKATVKITTALALGETISADGQTYTAQELSAGTPGNDATSQMKNLVKLINKNPDRMVVANYNDTDNVIELRNATIGNGNVAEVTAANGSVQLAGVIIAPNEVTSGAPTAAAATFDFSVLGGEFTTGETVEFGGHTIEFAPNVTDPASQVQLGANMAQTEANLASFLNGQQGSGEAGEVLDDTSAAITGNWTAKGTTLTFEAI